jgi:hypothetical protein
MATPRFLHPSCPTMLNVCRRHPAKATPCQGDLPRRHPAANVCKIQKAQEPTCLRGVLQRDAATQQAMVACMRCGALRHCGIESMDIEH